MRVGVLAAGSGTVLRAILERTEIGVVLVLTDRSCDATSVAAEFGVPSVVVERTDFGSDFDRFAYTKTVVAELHDAAVDLVAMAGFGTILESPIHDAYPLRILNTHPALLPAFKGWHAVRDALVAGVKITGCTVHFAGIEVDTGPILAQEAVPVVDGDTESTLHERIKAVERRLYPEVIARVARDLDSVGTDH